MFVTATPARLFSLAIAGQFLFGLVLGLPGSAPLLFNGNLDHAAVATRLWALTLFALVVAILPLLVRAVIARSSGQSLLAGVRLLRERPFQGLIGLLSLEFGLEAVLAGWTAAFAIAEAQAR